MATNTKGTLKYRKIQRTPQTGENAGKKQYLPSLPDNAQIIVEAYGIQAAGFDDVYAAYKAYQAQK